MASRRAPLSLTTVLASGLAAAPSALRFSSKGKLGSYPVGINDRPLRATLVLDPPPAAGGQCAETEFAFVSCRFDRSFSSVTCK